MPCRECKHGDRQMNFNIGHFNFKCGPVYDLKNTTRSEVVCMKWCIKIILGMLKQHYDYDHVWSEHIVFTKFWVPKTFKTFLNLYSRYNMHDRRWSIASLEQNITIIMLSFVNLKVSMVAAYRLILDVNCDYAILVEFLKETCE